MNSILISIFIVNVCGHQNLNLNNIVNSGANPQVHIHEVSDTNTQSKAQQLWSQYQDHDFMHNLDHLKEEANNLLYMQKSEQISNEESAFLFTKLHDFNSDDKLDGLELLLAVKHSLAHQNSSFETQDLENFSVYVDSELKLMDLNFDGFVDYGEIYTYMEANKKRSEPQPPQQQQQQPS